MTTSAPLRACPFVKRKAVYRTRRDAWSDIRGGMGRPSPASYDLRPFKCQCGGWHVSSMQFVALREDRGSRVWTVFSKGGLIGFHMRGPHNKGIAVEWTRRDVLVLMWALAKAMVRSSP